MISNPDAFRHSGRWLLSRFRVTLNIRRPVANFEDWIEQRPGETLNHPLSSGITLVVLATVFMRVKSIWSGAGFGLIRLHCLN